MEIVWQFGKYRLWGKTTRVHLIEVGPVPRMGVQPKKDLSITLQTLRPMGCGLPRENTLEIMHLFSSFQHSGEYKKQNLYLYINIKHSLHISQPLNSLSMGLTINSSTVMYLLSGFWQCYCYVVLSVICPFG